MKSIVRPGVAELVPYPPGKPIEELERELGIKGSIKLASNENPLGPSPKALMAIKANLHALNRYPDGSGYYLKSRLSSYYDIPMERIILGNGSNELIELAVRTFLSQGDEAVQHFPAFLIYEKVVTGAGGRMISVPVSDFQIDLQGIGRAVTPRTKLIFVTNPNNPTGAVLSKVEMAAFLDDIPDDVIVLLDEAYIDFVTDPEAARGLDLLNAHPLLFVVRTFSKLYGLAGLRIGYGFGSPDVIDYMNRVRQPFNANSLAQAAAIAALDDETFVADTLRTVGEGLHYLYAQLKNMGLETMPTHTNFFLIRVPHGGRLVYQAMLKEGVIVRAMDGYGLPDYIRINVGLPGENERFVKALEKVLGDLSAAADQSP